MDWAPYIVLIAPSVVGMLVAFSMVYFWKVAMGPARRPHNFSQIIVAMATGFLGCWLMWDVVYEGVDRQGAVVSLLTGVITPGAWRIILAIVRGRWPRVYAALKVKRVKYAAIESDEDVEEQETTITIDRRDDRTVVPDDDRRRSG